MNKKEILSEQGQLVVKHNDLIQKSQYDLTLEEHKVLLYITSKITPYDEFVKEYTFSIDNYCAVCNKDNSGGAYYPYLRDVMIKLKKRMIHIQTEEEDILVGWFAQVILDRKTKKTFRVMFAPALKPYLFGLSAYTTRYPVEYILPMESKYSVRLYEFLRSVCSLGYKQEYDLETIRRECGCVGKFTAYKDLRVNVIEPGLEEINRYTDLKVSYRAIKTGKKITAIEFSIMETADAEETRSLARLMALGTL